MVVSPDTRLVLRVCAWCPGAWAVLYIYKKADRLLGSSMAGCWQPDTALPGHQQMALLDAMVWPEDAGAGLSREERRGG